jgi:hypothetical protein
LIFPFSPSVYEKYSKKGRKCVEEEWFKNTHKMQAIK